MVTTVKNTTTQTTKLRSVSNVRAAETAAAPGEIDATPGFGGRASVHDSISVRDLVVRGTEPFKRRRRPAKGALESLIDEDERARILDTDLAPWRMICALDIRTRYGKFMGTGWFAGPRTVITAGHCVYDAQMGGWAEEIIVRPGLSGTRAPYEPQAAREFSTTDRWLESYDPDFDYAAIHLGEGARVVTEATGWFATSALNDAALLSQRVNVAGYPGDKGGDTQWFHAKQVVFVQEHRIFYDVDTIAGQSGAPVWLDTDEGPRVVGVHAYGVGASVPSIKANSAPRITSTVLERFRAWIENEP